MCRDGRNELNIKTYSGTEESSGGNKGFSLIELLIVIVILGILAAVTVFAVRGITDKGTTSACRTDQKTIETAVESYFARYGGTEIPYTGQGTVPTGVVVGAKADATLAASGFLRTASTKYLLTPTAVTNAVNGKTMSAIAAGGCPAPS